MPRQIRYIVPYCKSVKACRAGAIALCLLLGVMPQARGFVAPKNPPLPNVDVRVSEHAPPTPALAAQQQKAAALLKTRVPELNISYDSIVGSPRLINARTGFLTGPRGHGKAVSRAHLDAIPPDDPHRVIKAFLNEHAELFGHNAAILDSAMIERDYVTEHNGLRTVVWRQTLDDIPVLDGVFIGNITHRGELVNLSSQFLPDAARAADAEAPNRKALVAKPKISAVRAVAIAAANVGRHVDEKSLVAVKPPEEAAKKQAIAHDSFLGAACAQLVWVPVGRDRMRLCWQVTLSVRPRLEHYAVFVDARSGDVLVRRCLTKYIAPATYNVFTSDSPSPFSPGWPFPQSGQPPLTNRVFVTLDALSTIASPHGWVPDGPSPVTSGNNAVAFLWRQGNYEINPDTGEFELIPDRDLPQATVGRVFNFPLDLRQDPLNYADASIVQLFYMANWYHDKLYLMGFNERAGNFQSHNFGRGGRGGDPVICLVQALADWGEFDNAMFYAPPDGQSGWCIMYIWSGPNRDSSLDQEVVMHELTHGLTERMVGGGVGIYAQQSGALAEGWSDFYPLCLLSEPSDDVNGCYPIGGYSTYRIAGYEFTENYYFGIRRYPYTTDMTKNPLTFKDIDPTRADPHAGIPINPITGGGDPGQVHNAGEVWCVTLREVWANLVTKWGWQTGNQLALQLVTDSLRLLPPNPTYLEARDAVILADEILTGGENFVELWSAFAKRGMGASAKCPPSWRMIGVVEAFDLPPIAIPDGVLEVTVDPPSSAVLFSGETITNYVRVTDGRPVTNATITATVSTGGTLVFHNNGVGPDRRANDSIYTGTFSVPAGHLSVTITLVISAPGKETCTNTVVYFVTATPPNDRFADSIKVPVGGTNYISNNRRATLEPGEPVHAGVTTVGRSLWWKYVSPVTTNVLVDTVGSMFRTVVAVYTNNTLATLRPVVSAVDADGVRRAFVRFTALANVTYHIAVASYTATESGPLYLRVQPGGEPDTSPPAITITHPPSGLMVTTNRVILTGTAVDPPPSPTGIKHITISVNTMPAVGPGHTTILTPTAYFGGPSSTNWSASVGLLSGVNLIRVTATDYAGYESVPVTLEVTYRPVDPANDMFVNAIVLTNLAGTTTVNSLKATKEVGEPDHARNTGGKSVWWFFTAPTDGVLTLSTSNSTFDTVLAVYTGSRVDALAFVSANDDAYAGVRFSQITQAVRSNQTYRIAVDGCDGAAGVVYLSWSFAERPICRLSVQSSAGGAVSAMLGTTILSQSADVPSNAAVSLTATPYADYEFDIWEGDVLSFSNPLTVVVGGDMALTVQFKAIAYTDGFESGNLRTLAWTTAGAKPWIVQSTNVAAGQFAARSGRITNSETSSLFLTANFRAGTGSFRYMVSSEAGFDSLEFYVDGLRVGRWSGETGWSSFGFPLTAGVHTLEWRYAKDATGSAGLDAAFIDNVMLPLYMAPDASARARLTIRRTTDGVFFVEGVGQANQMYITQVSTNLTNWQNIATNIAFNGFFRVVDLGSLTNRTRFYRAVVPVQ